MTHPLIHPAHHAPLLSRAFSAFPRLGSDMMLKCIAILWLAIACCLSQTAYAQPKDTFDLPKPTTSPMSTKLLIKLDRLMQKPSTWDKIPKKVNMCFFLPDGTKGEIFQQAKKYLSNLPKFTEISEEVGIKMDVRFIKDTHVRLALKSTPLKRSATTDIFFKIYTSEAVVAEDFTARKCHAAIMSNMRARRFNKFVGSIDALGAVPDYKHLTTLIRVLASDKMNKDMVNKRYEVVGIMPAGAAYIFVNDRKINDLGKAAGKRVAVLDFDTSQQKMVQNMGAQPVSVDISTMGGKFNNGQVDIMAAPALLFEPFELYKGLTTNGKRNGKVKGAIIDFPLLQLTLVGMMHKDHFPDGVGQLIREYASHQLKPSYDFINKIEKAIPQKYWMKVPPHDMPSYHKLMRENRISMTKAGHYHPKMMRLLKRIRCQYNPKHYECSLQDE